jgi:hypothetical protein
METINISEGYVLEILRSDLQEKIWKHLFNIEKGKYISNAELYFNSDGMEVTSNSFDFGDEYTVIRIKYHTQFKKWYITMAHTLIYKHKRKLYA